MKEITELDKKRKAFLEAHPHLLQHKRFEFTHFFLKLGSCMIGRFIDQK